MVGALGVNQSLLFSAVFFLGSFLAGIGGAAQVPKGGANLLMDFNILASVFVVVVIGGMGSIAGAYIAAMLVSVLQGFGVLLLPQSTLVLMFVVMAVVLTVRPWGLLGKPELAGQTGAATAPEAPLRPMGARGRLVVLAVLAGLAAAAVHRRFLLDVLATDILILCLFARSLHFILGTGGLVSFGHAAYYGGGAYVAALAVSHFSAPMELALFLAPLGAGLLAIVIGWFCVRLTGVYFAMLTLAFAQVLWSIVFQWTSLTGGDDGILGIWPSAWAQGRVYYYLVLVLTVGGIVALNAMTHTPFGYALRGARDSHLRSEAIGINVKLVQWMAFAFAGAMAGLAGGLIAFAKGSVFPNEMEIARSFDALIMVLLGGVQSLTGPIIGRGGLHHPAGPDLALRLLAAHSRARHHRHRHRPAGRTGERRRSHRPPVRAHAAARTRHHEPPRGRWACKRALAASGRWRGFPSRSLKARCWRSSDPTAPASPPASTCSSASSVPMPALCVSTGARSPACARATSGAWEWDAPSRSPPPFPP